MQRTIFYTRKINAKTTTGRAVTFDTVTGRGLDVNKPYVFGWSNAGNILFGAAALVKMAEVGYFDTVPILPVLPGQSVISTIWHKFPDITPEIREDLYRCHFIQFGKVATAWLPYTLETAPAWYILQVFEYSTTFRDNMDSTPNPDYPAARAEYDRILAQWIEKFKTDFVLHQNYIQITPIFLPDTTSNAELIIQPGGTLWAWHENNKDGEKITVTRGQFYCPPTPIHDTEHPRYLISAAGSAGQPAFIRIKHLLS